MFKRFIALILSVTLMLGSIVQPAYASPLEETAKVFVMGFFEGLGGWTAVVAVCMAADTAASTVFPPAAALLPYCPAIGMAAGGVGALDGLKNAVAH